VGPILNGQAHGLNASNKFLSQDSSVFRLVFVSGS